MLKSMLLQDPEIQDLRLQLHETGAPADAIIDEAFQHFTKDANPGLQILVNLVKGFLVAKLKDQAKKTKGTTFFGKLWRKAFGGG